MKKQYKFLFASGGSGGHLFPAKKLALELTNLGHIVIFAGSGNNPLFQQSHEFSYQKIASSPIELKHPFRMIKQWMKGFFESIALIQKVKPDLVLGFGSFHTLPVLLAAKWKRVPLFLFSADATLGKVQKLFSFFSSGIFSPFGEGKKIIPVHSRSLAYHETKMAKEEALKKLGLEKGVLTLLVFGGSQGCQFFNETLPQIFVNFPEKLQIIHLTGNKSEEVLHIYEENGLKSYVKDFEKEMSILYSAADFAIVRAGAATLAELIHFKLPSLMIPYPFSYGHQTKNALFFSTIVQGGFFIEQKNFTKEAFEKILHLVSSYDPYLKILQENIENYQEKHEPSSNLHEKLLEIIKEKTYA